MARPDKYQYVDHEKPWRYREGDLTAKPKQVLHAF